MEGRGRDRPRERRRQRGEDRLQRTEEELKGGIKPPESLLVFLRPFFFAFLFLFFLFFFFFKAFSVDWGGGELGALHPCP